MNTSDVCPQWRECEQVCANVYVMCSHACVPTALPFLSLKCFPGHTLCPSLAHSSWSGQLYHSCGFLGSWTLTDSKFNSEICVV